MTKGNTKILIVDDDDQLARQLRQSLSLKNYTCSIANSGEEALKLLTQEEFDLVLLDLGLPGKSGLDVCQTVRAQSLLPPIIILSVYEKEQEKVKAFDLGADDYVTKPFGMDELLARIKVALRHAHSQEIQASQAFVVGPFIIDPVEQRAQLNENNLKLTRTEYKLLEVLCANKGRILTQKMLLYKVWGNVYTDENHYVHVYINHLRRKVEPDPMHPRYIKTEHGIGYRFVVDEHQ